MSAEALRTPATTQFGAKFAMETWVTAPAEAPYSKTIKVCADAVAAAMHAAIKPAPTVYTFLFVFIVFVLCFVAHALACSGELQFAEDCRLKPAAAR
jgi:hypothetical protein